MLRRRLNRLVGVYSIITTHIYTNTYILLAGDTEVLPLTYLTALPLPSNKVG